MPARKPAGTTASGLPGRRSLGGTASPASSSTRLPKAEAPKAAAQAKSPDKSEAGKGGGKGASLRREAEDLSDSDSDSGASNHQAPETNGSSPSKPRTSSPGRPNASADDSPVTRFLASLREKRGTVMRAWLLDLDRRGCGRVSNADLAAACRALGYPKEVKLIWDGLRREGTATSLRLHDLDAEEAANLDQFAEVLWVEAGLDLDRAWARIDPGNRMAVTAKEFESGVRRLGFQGNASLLFRGLDANGLGHLRRHDFDALERLVPASERLESCNSQGVQDLLSWARKMHGGIQMLLAQLGLAGGKDGGVLEVGDLAARLVSLGYPKGTAATTAAAVANSGGYPGGTHITGNALKSMLAGKPPEVPAPAPPRATSPSGAPRPGAGSPRKLWTDSIGNTSLVNSKRSAHTRTYFSTPVGTVRWGSPSASSRRPASPTPPAPAPAPVSPSSPSAAVQSSPAVAEPEAHSPQAPPPAASSTSPTATSPGSPPTSWLYCRSGPASGGADSARVRPGSLSPERAQEPIQTTGRASMPSLRSLRDRTGPPPGPARRVTVAGAR